MPDDYYKMYGPKNSDGEYELRIPRQQLGSQFKTVIKWFKDDPSVFDYLVEDPDGFFDIDEQSDELPVEVHDVLGCVRYTTQAELKRFMLMTHTLDAVGPEDDEEFDDLRDQVWDQIHDMSFLEEEDRWMKYELFNKKFFLGMPVAQAEKISDRMLSTEAAFDRIFDISLGVHERVCEEIRRRRNSA